MIVLGLAGALLALAVALVPPALGYRGRDLLLGYRFRGRVELASGRAVWCKENPRPLHPDTEEFVTAPLARACTG